MSRVRNAMFLMALVLAGGALYSSPGSAQALPSAKVSSALGPLFKKARKQDIKQAQRSQDFMAQLGQMLAAALVSGGSAPDDTPYSTYVRLSQSLESNARERKVLQAAVESGLVPPDQRAPGTLARSRAGP